jgi:hypothetical protein
MGREFWIMREFLIGERDKRMREQRDLIRRAEILNAELDLLKTIIAKFDVGKSSEHAPTTTLVRRAPFPNSKRTRLSPRWLPVLKVAVERFPNSIQFEEVPDIQRAAGQLPSDTNNIRSHVWTQSNAGLYEKTGSGSFRATEKAAEAIGLPLQKIPDDGFDPSALSEDYSPSDDELFGTPKANGIASALYS